ncbi:hypothetical protein PanWU01x14_153430 [Parasponia andersonii]|uniref:Uncharacterized protein n=1 Tax=Parasponia andersonii TaxID=3476 RepID=A0A2P5CH40_PARAD|nr:hypothetical protein PanWU01x14_153430 [Parasponia andersonii]
MFCCRFNLVCETILFELHCRYCWTGSFALHITGRRIHLFRLKIAFNFSFFLSIVSSFELYLTKLYKHIRTRSN